MKKTLASILCAILAMSLGIPALAYPNEGKSYDVSKPAGRDYFPSDISELPVCDTLPDLFQFLNPELGTNGRVVTEEDWQERRAEIADLVQYYYLGYKQPTRQEDVKVSKYLRITPGYWVFDETGFRIVPDDITETDTPFLGDATQTGGMYITVTNPDTGVSANILVNSIYVPKYTENAELQSGETNVKGPYPMILGVGGGVSATARDEVLKRGYALVTLNTASVYTDTTWADANATAYRTGAYTALYPYDPNVYEYNSGALMGWAWGISRIIDAVANGAYEGLLDPTRTVVTGVSRNGKAALIAGAFDERISIVAPADPGQTGTASYRYTDQGQLFNYQMPNAMNRVYARNEKPTNVLEDAEAHWLNSKAEDFRNNVNSLPFDAHSVEALVAPRPLIIFTGEEFDWLGSPSNILCNSAAAEAYSFLGADGNTGVRVHDGAHALQDRDVPFIMAIMDREFHNGGEGDLIVEDCYAQTEPPSNSAGTYRTISEFTASPYEVDSSRIRWSEPGAYTLWVEQELICAGIPASVIAHTDAAEAVLTLPDGTEMSEKAVDGIAAFALEAPLQGRYAVSVSGEKKAKTVHFQAMTLSDALRHGITGNNAGSDAVHPIFGFTSRVDAASIEVYADGVKLTNSTNEKDGSAYILDYGFKVEEAVTYDVVTVKHLKLAAIPGFTAEVSFDKALYLTLAPEGSSSDDARERPSWAPSDSAISANSIWPIYPNTLADDGKREPMAATPTAFDTVITFSEPENGAFTVSFSEPVNKNEFGIAMDFAETWTLTWAEDSMSVTVAYDAAPEAGTVCTAAIFRLRDMENNMIGQNGIAGPVFTSFTAK